MLFDVDSLLDAEVHLNFSPAGSYQNQTKSRSMPVT